MLCVHDQVDEVVFLGAAVDWNVVTGQEPSQLASGEVLRQIVRGVVARLQCPAFCARRPTAAAAVPAADRGHAACTVQLTASAALLSTTSTAVSIIYNLLLRNLCIPCLSVLVKTERQGICYLCEEFSDA